MTDMYEVQEGFMVVSCNLQLLDRDDSHQEDPESPNTRSPLHLAVSQHPVMRFHLEVPVLLVVVPI